MEVDEIDLVSEDGVNIGGDRAEGTHIEPDAAAAGPSMLNKPAIKHEEEEQQQQQTDHEPSSAVAPAATPSRLLEAQDLPDPAAATASDRCVSSRPAKAAAKLGIKRTVRTEQHINPEDDTDDENDITPAACYTSMQRSSAQYIAGKRAKVTAAARPLHMLPHGAVKWMRAKYGSSYRLDLQLQKDRAALAWKVATVLDASPTTQGFRSSDLTDLVLASAFMLGHTVTYTPAADTRVDLKQSCLKGKIVDGGKIQCLGCDKTMTRCVFEAHTGSTKRRATEFIIIDAVDLSIKRFVHLSSIIDLHLSACVFCWQAGPSQQQQEQQPEVISNKFVTCSTCPAVFHPSCYVRCTGQPVDEAEFWECASCTAAAACAAAGCGWCERHGTADSRVDMHAEWEQHKQALTTTAAAAAGEGDQVIERKGTSEEQGTAYHSAHDTQPSACSDPSRQPGEASQRYVDGSCSGGTEAVASDTEAEAGPGAAALPPESAAAEPASALVQDELLEAAAPAAPLAAAPNHASGVAGDGAATPPQGMSLRDAAALLVKANQLLAAVRPTGQDADAARLASCDAASSHLRSLAVQLGLRGRSNDKQLLGQELQQQVKWLQFCSQEIRDSHSDLAFPERLTEVWKERVLELLNDL